MFIKRNLTTDEITNAMVNPKRRIGKLSDLCRKGIIVSRNDAIRTYNDVFDATRNYNDLFDAMCDSGFGFFQLCACYLDSVMRSYQDENKLKEEAAIIRKSIIEYGYSKYPNVTQSKEMDKQIDDACYDIILRYTFGIATYPDVLSHYEEMVKRAFIWIYGDKYYSISNKKTA